MSMTWGRRPLPELRASLGQRVALILCALVIALVSGTADPFVRPLPSLLGPEAARTIQGLFELHRAAAERGDRVSYELTLDPRSRAFVACMQRHLDARGARAEALAPARVAGLDEVPGTNLVRVRLEQRDGIGIHYVRRFLVGPVTAFPWIDLMRSVPAWYVSYPDEGDLNSAPPLPAGVIDGSGCGRDGPSRVR